MLATYTYVPHYSLYCKARKFHGYLASYNIILSKVYNYYKFLIIIIINVHFQNLSRNRVQNYISLSTVNLQLRIVTHTEEVKQTNTKE